jgi:Leucine-rich repeat (LRR) protein
MWTEIQQVQEHQRHELVLTGPEVAQRVAENGLDEHLYNLAMLNFLEISKTPLATLDSRIGQLKNLTRLVLHYNKLKELPGTRLNFRSARWFFLCSSLLLF